MISTKDIISQLYYEGIPYEYQKEDSTCYRWDKGDCSQVGQLLCFLKYTLECKLEEPYYEDSYHKHRELYEMLFVENDFIC